MKRPIIVLAVLTFLCLMYFATQVSATYPPIKTYNYSLTNKELHRELLTVVSENPTWTFMVRDSFGKVDDRKYYCEFYKVSARDSLTFTIFFQKTDHLLDKRTRSEIGLVQVWDNFKWKGGTKIDDAGVKTLVELFETDIISKLPMNTSR